MSHFVRTFKPQFTTLVESGHKLQTIRPVPKRRPRPGDTISLRTWSGKPYRSKQRILREAIVTGVNDILIESTGVVLWAANGAGYAPACDFFAIKDGFKSWDEMRDWFQTEHGLPFSGIVIFWRPVS